MQGAAPTRDPPLALSSLLMTKIETIQGLAFVDRPYRLCGEKVGEFIAVTGDDPDRWQESAPPGMSAALLFVVAPELLGHPAVRGAVIHGDQSFVWHRPLRVEADLSVTGTVERVRQRGDVAFVTFALEASDTEGVLVEGKSTFLMGEEVGGDTAEIVPGEVGARGATVPVDAPLPAPRSASRHDLVRYAAATRDWNPIHWDHGTAVEAGLGGVVVHGLLQSAWLTQVAAAHGTGDRPLESAKYRYKAPLRPGESAEIRGDVDEIDADLELVRDETVTVTGKFRLTS